MEKPILFNTEMVKAILEGRKTTTRRVLKKPFEVHPNGFVTKPKGNERLIPYEPPYEIGDILYVRETWNFLNCYECDACGSCHEYPVKYKNNEGCFAYKVDSKVDMDLWKPSIHMPKVVSRIFLKVTNVRAERLQDMEVDDFEKEGIGTVEDIVFKDLDNLADKFGTLWDGTTKEEQYKWNSNPWVWVIEFESIDNHE